MIGDIVAKAVVVYKADTTDLKRGIKSVDKAESDLAGAQLARVNESNARLESSIAKWGKVAAGLGAVALAGKFAFDAIDKYGKHLDLVGAAGKVSLEGLSKAAMGLKTNMQLLEHAAKLQSSAFKFTQGQMETVERAMFALEEQGRDSTEVWNAVSTALTKGTTRSLEGLGIIIDKTGLAFDDNGLKMDTYGQKAEVVSRVMAALTKTAGEAKDAQLDAADEVQAATTRLKNYYDEAIIKIGEISTKLTPVIDGLASAIGAAQRLIDMLPKGPGGVSIGSGLGGGLSTIKEKGRQRDQRNASARLDAARIAKEMDAGAVGFGLPRVDLNGIAGEVLNRIGDAVGTAAGFDPWGDTKATKSGKRAGRRSASYIRGVNFDPDGASASLGSYADSGGEFGSDKLRAALYGSNARTEADYETTRAAKQSSFLESTFGSLSEFDAYKTAFDTLSGGVASAMTAWIDGSMSAGAAFKKFIAEAVKGIAVQMAMEALKHGAYAIGSLAFGDVRGATMHAKAAALHAAGAIAAGAAAKGLSSGGGGPAAGVGAPGGGVPTGVGGGSAPPAQGSNVTIVYGQDFTNQSSRQRALHAERIVNEAKGAGGVTYA